MIKERAPGILVLAHLLLATIENLTDPSGSKWPLVNCGA